LLDDVDGEVRSRVAVVCHVWPGITPMTLRDMAFSDWVVIAASADEWVKNRKEAAARG